MKKIKYLTPILGLSAMMGVAAPIITSCSKAVNTTVPTEELLIEGVTLKGFAEGVDVSKYDTISLPESVKRIDTNAFGSKVYPTIKTLKLPKTIAKINGGAFKGLTNLTTIDLTDWDYSTIIYLDLTEATAANPVLGSYTTNRYCEIKTTGLSLNSEELLKEKFTSAAVNAPLWWFTAQTTGHVALTEGVQTSLEALQTKNTTTQTSKYAAATNSITLTNVLDTNKYEIYVYPQINACTDVNADYITLPTTAAEIKDYKKIDLAMKMYANVNDVADYQLNVVCKRADKDEIVWVQKVDGLKLTYRYQTVSSVTLASHDPIYVPFNLADTGATVVNPTVAPADAVNSSIEWTIADAKVASHTDSAAGTLVKPTGFGATSLIVNSKEDPTKADAIAINVNEAIIDQQDSSLKTSYNAPACANAKIYYCVQLANTNLIAKLAPNAGTADCRYAQLIVNGEVYKFIDKYALNVYVIRSGTSQPIQLILGTDYEITQEGTFVFKDNGATGDRLTRLTWNAGDVLYFEWDIKNTQALDKVDFKFVGNGIN